jgi:hypothetical protein
MTLSKAPDVWDGTIPVTQAWMKKDYCPYLAACVGPESTQWSLKWVLDREMRKDPNSITMLKWNPNLVVQRTFKQGTTAYGDIIPRGELALFVMFFTPDNHLKDHYDSTQVLSDDYYRSERYSGIFPLDERLYVLPYIFHHRRVTASIGNSLVPYDFLFEVPENHRKLLSLNLIEGDIRKNSFHQSRRPETMRLL